MSKFRLILTSVTVMGFTTMFSAAIAQEPATDTVADDYPRITDADPTRDVAYPIAVAVDHSTDAPVVYTVDLELPGVWKSTAGETTLFHGGTKYLRKPMNRPRPIATHPGGGILVGDSPTREIYHITSADQLKPLNDGFLGIPMALAVSPDGETIYVGDAERRATFKLPIGGGQPELVARVNARGLAFADDHTLYAVTPDADAVVSIDVRSGDTEVICGDRPFEYPGGLVWMGDYGLVSDVYAKALWKFTADGKVEKWIEGDPFTGPVLIAAGGGKVYVPDPRSKQVYRIDPSDKSIEKMLP